MIRKLLFAAAAAFVGKKLMDRNRDNKSMNGTGSQRATDRGNRSASYTGSTGGAAGGHVPPELMTDHHPGPNEPADEEFCPDPHSTVAAGDRHSMRPAKKTVGSTSAPTGTDHLSLHSTSTESGRG